MEPRRFFHILKARWWLIVIVALAGAAAAFALTRASNASIEPLFEADASIRVFRVSNESEPVYQARLEVRREQIETVVRDQLVANPNLSVISSPITERLVLRATSPDEAIAEHQARELRDQYLTAETVVSDSEQIQTTLDSLAAGIRELRALIDAQTAEPVEDPTDRLVRLALESEASTLRQQAAALQLQLSLPSQFPPFGIEEPEEPIEGEVPLLSEFELRLQLSRVETALMEVEQELETVALSDEPLSEDNLDLLVLQRRLTDLETQYVELSVELVSAGDGEVAIDPVVPVFERTPQRQSPRQAAAVGFLGAALLAMTGLLVIDRIRRPILGVEDIAERSPLGVIHRDRSASDPSLPWYPQAATSSRRREIQTARARLDSLVGDGASAILVSGVSVRGDGREFAADLASSFAAAGRRVALIDASGETGSTLPEFGQLDMRLTDLVVGGLHGVGHEDRRAALKNALSETMPVSQGLVSFTLDTKSLDAVDLFAGVGFRLLIEAARAEFDLVVMAGPDVTDLSTPMIAQRSDLVVLVSGLRQTTEAELDRVDALLGVDQKTVYVAALTGRERFAVGASLRSYGVPQRILRKLAKGFFAFVDLFRGRFPGPRVLSYHQVGTSFGREMEVSTRAFSYQISWLLNRGEIIRLEDLFDRYDEPDADRLFVLTFDDGFADVYHNAFPVLQELGVPFTLYLATSPIETGHPMDPKYPGAAPLTWEQVREMQASGLMTIGAHTHTHPDLRMLSTEEIERELSISDYLIEMNTGLRPRHFAYPWGYWSPLATGVVRERYESATVGSGPPIDRNTSEYAVYRTPVQRSDGTWLFRRRIVGGFRLEDLVRRRLNRYSGP